MNMDREIQKGKLCFWMVMMMTAIFLTGCAETVRVGRLKPAEINISGYKKIAVGQITGRNGESVRDKLEQALMESNRFEVLDRSNLGRIMQEQGFSQSGAVDEKDAVQIGKMASSAAMIFGNVSRRDYRQQQTYDDIYCQDQYKRQYKCGKTYYINGYWNNQVYFKVVDTSTGKTLASKNIPNSYKATVSAQNAIPAINWDPESVMGNMENGIVQEFMKAIAPYRVVEQVKMHKDSKLPELEAGINCCKTGQWETAIEQFRAAVEKADTMPGIDPKVRARARYDLGVALGYSGKFDEGIQEIEKAMQINSEPDFATEIAKIKMFKRDEERLRQQGVETAPSSRRTRVIVVG